MPNKPKRSKLKPPGKCIFCGRTAGSIDPDSGKTLSMSKQHLFPVWMHKEFPKTAVSNSQLLTRFKGGRLQSDLRERQGDIKARQLRIVCKEHCNGGWIRTLEEATSKFLRSLMKGEKFTLLPQQQELLALWICVETIIWEYTHPPSICVPEAHRTYVYENREPPAGWNIWIGLNKGRGWDCRSAHFSYTVETPRAANFKLVGTSPYNYQVTSLQIGQLFMHASSCTAAPGVAHDSAFRHSGLKRIWPLRGRKISWPSNYLLNDVAATTIANRVNAIALVRS